VLSVVLDNDKASMYIVAIVGVVAAVGILMLFTGATISENLSGEAYLGDGKFGTVREAKYKARVEDAKKEAEKQEADKKNEEKDDNKDKDDKSGVQEEGCPEGEVC
jgi:hypothetical protein